MKRTVTTLTTSLFFFFVAMQAQAQDFGQQGQLAVGAERLFGYVSTENTVEPDGSTLKVTATENAFTFLVNGADSFFATARLGLDYFVIDGLSLGGSLGYLSGSTKTEVKGSGLLAGSTKTSTTGFLFAPRVGYAAMFSPTVGLWPRGGITYVHSVDEDDNNNDTTTNVTAFSLEAPLAIVPAEGFGFLIGPTFDIGVTGSVKDDASGMKGDVSTTAIGLQAGMFGYF